jgi:uncharacterized protein (TIGR02996 family)
MDPHLPFLRAIAANPPDDLPRLVYADFLEESGEAVHVARAHFIRTQIALETLPPKSREYREAKALERQLLQAHETQWLRALPEYLREYERVTWRRGFPFEIRIGLIPYEGMDRDLNADWFDTQPVQCVHFERQFGPGWSGWTERIRWTWITNLRLGPGLETHDEGGDHPVFAELLTFRGFVTLCTLDLSGNRLTDAWLVRFVSEFADTSFAATLDELDLSRCFQLTDAGANTLATARDLGRLKALRLKDVPLSPAAVAMLRRRYGDGLVV